MTVEISPAEAKLEDLRLFSGTANQPLAAAVAGELGIQLSPVTITHLADSEIHVKIDELVRHQDIYIIQPCAQPVNDNFMELLLLIDAFRRASARYINVVVPYFPYARQDRMATGREAISAKMVARMLEMAGASRVVYVDIHSLQIQGFFEIPVDPLSALPVLAGYFQDEARFPVDETVIVSPDVGRARLAGKYAEQLGMGLVVMHKRRLGFSQTKTTTVVGDIEGKTAILIDDMVAGGSVLEQIPALIEAGAKPPVYLSITHPVLLPSALRRLDRDYIAELVTTNSIYIPPEKMHPKIRVQSIAHLLADVILRIHCGKTISPLLRLL
ncbi:MAG: Ribose-phosphate pyrophosphokinase [Anaerolineae bacterium]|nr:Ribose-phosphate pyrophosphokinase [Anaerolineae bacterium]